MLRIDALKLIQTWISEPLRFGITVILSDNLIFKRLLEEKLATNSTQKTLVLSGKAAVQECVEHAASGSLFAAPSNTLVLLPEKLTQKQWNEDKKYLLRLPAQLDLSCGFFGPTLLRNVLKETDFTKNTKLYLCYEPNDSEKQKCAEALLSRYNFIPSHALQPTAQKALDYYSGDLLTCDMHFARMQQGRLSFSDALAGTPEINSFHVVEALAKGDKFGIEQRIAQCAQCGEEAFGIFMAIFYFVKQLALVQSALEENKNIKDAFAKCHIPYPAQAKIEAGLKIFSRAKIALFLMTAAQLEMDLRQQKTPHVYLATELLGWLSASAH